MPDFRRIGRQLALGLRRDNAQVVCNVNSIVLTISRVMKHFELRIREQVLL